MIPLIGNTKKMAGGYVVISDFHHSELAADDPEWKSQWTVTQVMPNIYISNWYNAVDKKVLLEYNIKGILCLGESDKPPLVHEMYKKLGIDHRFLKIEDSLGEDLSRYFNDIWEFIMLILSKGKRVMVHCTGGVSRSPAAVAFFMIRRLYENPQKPTSVMIEKIINTLKKLRTCISINKSFINQIANYEAEKLGIKHKEIKVDIFAEDKKDDS